MTDLCRTFSGVVLLAALAIAPLNYASTRLIPFQTLIALTAVGVLSWLVSGLFARRISLPALPAQIGVLLIAVSAGAWLLLFVRPELPEFTAKHLARLTARWPYSMVPRDSVLLLTWSASAVGACFALADLGRASAWRSAIAGVMLVSGSAVAVLGLLQNATHARGIYWSNDVRMPGAFFGTFFHHTSAGAYINSVWPLGFALGLDGIRSGTESIGARKVIYGSLVCSALVLAAHSGHVSRLPQVIAVVVLVGFTLWVGLWKALGQVRGLRIAVGIVSAVLVLAVLGFGATRLRDISSRWNQIEWHGLRGGSPMAVVPPPQQWLSLMRDDLFIPSDHGAYPLGDRGAAYTTAWEAIKTHPWFGWGPGGWTAAAAALSLDPFIRTFYLMTQYTHNDYLQTLVEWGVIGALGWALLVPGAMINAFIRLSRRPSRDFIGAAAAVGLLAILAQSLIDFPLQITAIQFNAVALVALAWSAPGRGGAHAANGTLRS